MKDKRLSFAFPVFDLRVVSLVLCTFFSGMYAAAHMGARYTVCGSMRIAESLIVSLLRYFSLISLSIAAYKMKFMRIVLFLYVSVCSCIFGYFTYAFFTTNTVVLFSVVLPMLIYCYVMTVFSSAVLLKNKTVQADDGVIHGHDDEFYATLLWRWRIVAAGILLEGVIAPWL